MRNVATNESGRKREGAKGRRIPGVTLHDRIDNVTSLCMSDVQENMAMKESKIR